MRAATDPGISKSNMMGSPPRPGGGRGVSNITVEPDSELDSLRIKSKDLKLYMFQTVFLCTMVKLLPQQNEHLLSLPFVLILLLGIISMGRIPSAVPVLFSPKEYVNQFPEKGNLEIEIAKMGIVVKNSVYASFCLMHTILILETMYCPLCCILV